MSEIERIISRLKNLKQYKDLSQEDLELMAKEQLDKNDILSSLTFCIDDEEKEYANKLIEMYLAESSIESNSDKDTLKQLIDLEILVERIKSFLKTEFSKTNPAIPTHMLQELRDTNAQIILMKEKLGLSQHEKSEDSGLTLFENLKKKAQEYYKTHAGCNLIRCPECSKLFMVMMRTKDLDAKKATLFRNTILYNVKLFDLYHQKRISAEEIAEILGVSVLDIDFLYINIYLKELNAA